MEYLLPHRVHHYVLHTPRCARKRSVEKADQLAGDDLYRQLITKTGINRMSKRNTSGIACPERSRGKRIDLMPVLLLLQPAQYIRVNFLRGFFPDNKVGMSVICIVPICHREYAHAFILRRDIIVREMNAHRRRKTII